MRRALALLCLAACAQRPATVATTSGEIAIANLSAQIAGQERLLTRRPGSVAEIAALVELLQARAQYTGSVGDFRRVAQLGELAVRSVPGDAEARMARASSRAALHRFAAALADLDVVGDTAASQSLRASILQAQGHTDAALRLRRAAVAEYANTRALGSLAAAEGAAGDVDGALRDFAAAERAYRDTSPLPLAWIDFQRGLLLEKHGRFDEALAACSAAALRLPQFAQAQAHLAGLLALRGDKARAVEVLRPLAALDDPEYSGQLAALTADARMRADTARRYEALLGEFPEAFADHAARFFLPFDAGRALELARVNLAVRQTPEAFDLALTAVVAAGAVDCPLAERARALNSGVNRLRLMASRACPQTASR